MNKHMIKLSANLNVWDRMTIYDVVAAQSGTIRIMRQVQKILDIIELTPDEKAKVEFVEEGSSITWKDTEYTKEIDFGDPNLYTVLSTWMRQHPWRGINAKRTIALFEKMGIADDEPTH